jgi:hypothetical protein
MMWIAAVYAADLQRITVVVQNAPSGTTMYAADRGGPPVQLTDAGVGSLSTSFEGPPARAMQLQLIAEQNGQRRRVYDGTEVLADVHDDTLTFAWDVNVGVRRVAGSPSSVIPFLRSDDAALQVGFAWAGLALAWFLGMAVVWARRRP